MYFIQETGNKNKGYSGLVREDTNQSIWMVDYNATLSGFRSALTVILILYEYHPFRITNRYC